MPSSVYIPCLPPHLNNVVAETWLFDTDRVALQVVILQSLEPLLFTATRFRECGL